MTGGRKKSYKVHIFNAVTQIAKTLIMWSINEEVDKQKNADVSKNGYIPKFLFSKAMKVAKVIAWYLLYFSSYWSLYAAADQKSPCLPGIGLEIICKILIMMENLSKIKYWMDVPCLWYQAKKKIPRNSDICGTAFSIYV